MKSIRKKQRRLIGLMRIGATAYVRKRMDSEKVLKSLTSLDVDSKGEGDPRAILSESMDLDMDLDEGRCWISGVGLEIYFRSGLEVIFDYHMDHLRNLCQEKFRTQSVVFDRERWLDRQLVHSQYRAALAIESAHKGPSPYDADLSNNIRRSALGCLDAEAIPRELLECQQYMINAESEVETIKRLAKE